MKPVIAASILVGWLLTFPALSQNATNYQKTSTPDWVEIRPLNTDVKAPTELISNGTFYRIVDDQIRVTQTGESQYYSRMVKTVVNQKGLNESSQIQIDFDPSYQSLLIHDIKVFRDGQASDRFDSSEISVFHSEDSFEQQVYSGTVTFNVILNDVTVGDTVDYSYSILGSNPVYSGLFSESRTLVWSVPVQDQYHRVLWGKSEALHVAQRNGMFPVSEKRVGAFRDYSIHVNMASPQRFSSESPAWDVPYHQVFYSETPAWEQVNDWALGLYADLGADDAVKAVAESIRQQASEPKQQLALALRFVQENIRYVAIQIADNSHLPTPASDTLRLKYGDCKDKSVLMLALMAELGIKGYPALVNTDIGKTLDQITPSINRFDHVIVNALVGETQYWLDPTMSNQVGPLENLYQPDFGFALVVKPGEESLTRMNASAATDILIEETYTLPVEVAQPAKLEVVTSYAGWQAQRILSQVQNDGAASIRDQYLEYYQRSFPGASSLMPIEINTNTDSGWVTLKEQYQIDNAFTEEDEGYKIYFYSTDIRNQLSRPKDVDRNAPYARNFPKKISNKIVLKFLEEDWEFDDEVFKEENAFFSFIYSTKFVNNVLTLNFQYESKQDHVPADDINTYLEALDRARDYTSYSIIKYKNTSTAAESTETLPTASEEQGVNQEVTFILWYLGAFVILFCLMLVDWRFAATGRKDSDALWFQPTSRTKFFVLGFLTLGLYCSYWVYRNWLLIDRHEKKGIWPIARGIFSVFWLYPLYIKLVEHRANQGDCPSLFPKYLAIILAVLYVVLGALAGLIEDATINTLAYLAMPIVFLPFINYINRLYPKETKDYSNGAKVGFRHVFISLIFLPFILMSVGQATYLTPTGQVIEGDELWVHDIEFMQRENILNEADKVEFFYSDALFSIRRDGNGFTQQKVFSYWIDEESGLDTESADYEQIKDIKIEFAKSEEENTTVTLVRDDNTDFLLFVSAVKKKDRVFAEALLNNWKAKRVGH